MPSIENTFVIKIVAIPTIPIPILTSAKKGGSLVIYRLASLWKEREPELESIHGYEIL
jgi:hypothetical protein